MTRRRIRDCAFEVSKNRAIPVGAGTATGFSSGRFRSNSGAIANVTARCRLMTRRHYMGTRKCHPSPGGVFFDFETRYQLLTLDSILIP
jgi:hypothetical protein